MGCSRIEPVEAGSYSSGRCDVNRIAGPDNLAVLNDGSLLIAEDTENTMITCYGIGNLPLSHLIGTTSMM